mmetsp:Transcript_22941/g.25515  ORF Transcript_22941/g.25515 Transcript_22941/m.25515 type:complete len:270 (+) Transcript_22941:116-925(+)
MEGKEVKKLEKIGSGRFGDVYRVEVDGVTCALKECNVNSSNAKASKYLATELEILTSVQHANIVRLVGTQRLTAGVSIFMELLPFDLPGLIQRIRSEERTSFGVSEIKKLAGDMTRGLMYLHDRGFIHRDVKGSNILLSVDEKKRITTAKICDFGLAIKVDRDNLPSNQVGSLRWMAPEVYEEETYDEKIDVWGIGITLIEAITCDKPFKHVAIVLDVKDAIFKNELVGVINKLPKQFSTVTPLLLHCTHIHPKKRASTTQVLDYLIVK